MAKSKNKDKKTSEVNPNVSSSYWEKNNATFFTTKLFISIVSIIGGLLGLAWGSQALYGILLAIGAVIISELLFFFILKTKLNKNFMLISWARWSIDIFIAAAMISIGVFAINIPLSGSSEVYEATMSYVNIFALLAVVTLNFNAPLFAYLFEKLTLYLKKA